MVEIKFKRNKKVILGDMSKIKIGEVIYLLDENKFKAVSFIIKYCTQNFQLIKNNKFVKKRKK